MSTVVLIPGLMCDQAVWEPVLPHFRPQGASVVLADHGLADNLTQMAQQVLDQTAGPLALVGHSMGGRIALEALRLAPQRIDKILVMSSGHTPRAAGALGEKERAKRQALLDLARQQGVGAMAREWVQGMVAPHRLSDTALLDRIVAMFERKTVAHFEAQIRALLERPDASGVLQTATQEVWLACSEFDSWAPVSQHQAMAEMTPRAQLRVLAGLGHMISMEDPAAVGALLQSWWASNPDAAASPSP